MIISLPVHTALALYRLRSGPAASVRHPFGRAGPAPGSVGAPTRGPSPLGTVPAPPPDPPVPPPPVPGRVPEPPVADGPVPPAAGGGLAPVPSPAVPPGWVVTVGSGFFAASCLSPDRQPAAASRTAKARTARRVETAAG